MAVGQITHIELPSDDLERATSFYSQLFGWDMRQIPEMPNYAMFQDRPGESGGAIGLRGQTAPNRLRKYDEVETMDATVAKLADHGATDAD